MLPYQLDTTNDLLTSRAGLLAVAQLMESLQLSERIDQHFPLPQSNRGLPPSTFIKTLLLMHHEGGVHLDDSRHLRDDEALRTVLNLTHIPKATTLGDWLRRMGNQPQIQAAWNRVNQAVWQSALHRCKKVTLDIDTTAIIAHKAEAQWTYNKNKGYMPMMGHIAETGQIIDGQSYLDLEPQREAEVVTVGGYTYRAIATNRNHSSDSQLIHGYNQRAEDSENRIKELKLDVGGDTWPCSDFNANARYFLITALSYNVLP